MSRPAPGGEAPSLPMVRPPLQKRSREAWERILNAGVTIMETRGYEAFTIAAVCEQAGVAPRAVYDRVDDKDALFLAVYEHGIARVRADEAVFEGERWDGVPPDRLVDQAVRELAGIFAKHAAFLRSVVLISGVHEEVYRRGAKYSRAVGDRFTGLLLRCRGEIRHEDPEGAVRLVFTTLFSTLVLRTAYGPAFTTNPLADKDFLSMLTDMARRYLLG
ncbi:DNA-binding transcriptional regulator, AcrR family [Amycolatopsis sacchari]|uniref:DNA-binding transcriptional regulator, AcrR family n=1 Tax=Amycolatopsis sacchari TaxID=115433 RepID=A0A1I4C4L0_9PSEU|nr:TetR/AcrR family transcriptional regulator [Amycolatopsis sacchari]SFK76058.1 DNA-binding transcriptional regulator, AcrR family [Amycolatopsis sacchari]